MPADRNGSNDICKENTNVLRSARSGILLSPGRVWLNLLVPTHCHCCCTGVLFSILQPFVFNRAAIVGITSSSATRGPGPGPS